MQDYEKSKMKEVETKIVRTQAKLEKVKEEIFVLRRNGDKDKYYYIELQQKQFSLEKELQRLEKQKRLMNHRA